MSWNTSKISNFEPILSLDLWFKFKEKYYVKYVGAKSKINAKKFANRPKLGQKYELKSYFLHSKSKIYFDLNF